MNENSNEIFLTRLTDENQIKSIHFNDDNEDDLDIDVKSSTDSVDSTERIREIQDVLNEQEVSSVLIPNTENVDLMDEKLSNENPSTPVNDQSIQMIVPKSLYDYAVNVQKTFETPRQNKLDHDVTVVLGTSDPPPGFGFLHPRFYYLEQKQPIPLAPIRVWRGYHGHVYFSPIEVQHFENSAKSFQLPETQSVPLIKRTVTPQSNIKSLKPHTAKSNNKSHTQTTTTSVINPSINKMWQSVVTCAQVHSKPISKRSQHAIEDQQAFQQEQTLQDPTGYNRQVLPNIRPVPKSKFVYKGLAYKETQKLPGITNGNDNDDNVLQKPLVAYNLAQAYASYEIKATRTKQNLRPPPPSAVTAAILKEQQNAYHTTLDIREMRKRIVRGTTLSYRPPAQSIAWTPGRGEHRSTLASESGFCRPSTSKSSIPQKQTTVIEMPILTRNINHPRDSSRYTPSSELVTAAS